MGDITHKIRKKIVSAISDYQLLEDGDKVLVAVSGGVDSTVMALQLEEIRKRAKINFQIVPVILDQKQPGFDAAPFKSYLEQNGFELVVLEHDTYSVIQERTPKGKSICQLCSCQRRGILYNYAHQEGFTKIALGHQLDDFNETLLLNMLYAGVTASMTPKKISDDGRNTVIRPLCYVSKDLIKSLATTLSFPVIPDNLCGYAGNSTRLKIRSLLVNLKQFHPDYAANLFAAQKNLKPDRLPIAPEK